MAEPRAAVRAAGRRLMRRGARGVRGSAGGVRPVGRDRRTGVGQLRPRYAGPAQPGGTGLWRFGR